MELQKIKLTRSPELDEARKITDDITKKLFKNYSPISIPTSTPTSTPISNTSISDMDAYETIEDLCAIHNIVHRMILRRNASYSKHSQTIHD
jgi:hypothetical protein